MKTTLYEKVKYVIERFLFHGKKFVSDTSEVFKNRIDTAEEAKDYENFDGLLDVMKNQTYITWEKLENGDYKIDLTDNFFKAFKGVINML